MRNDDIGEKLKVENITERCRKARLRWFGHVKRRDQEYVGRKTLEMVPPGRRKRGRPKQRWMDCVNRDMRAIRTTKDEVHDRTGWRRIVSAAVTPQPSGSSYKKKMIGCSLNLKVRDILCALRFVREVNVSMSHGGRDPCGTKGMSTGSGPELPLSVTLTGCLRQCRPHVSIDKT